MFEPGIVINSKYQGGMISQWVEHLSSNPRVSGSILSTPKRHVDVSLNNTLKKCSGADTVLAAAQTTKSLMGLIKYLL